MDKNQKAARIVGVLFIITMIAGGIDGNFIAPILNNSLMNIYLNQNLVIIGALLILVMSLGIVGISIVLYPVLKKHNEAIALTYVSFRIIESVFLVFGTICYFFLIKLSQEYMNAKPQDVSYFLILAALAIKMKYYAYQIAMITLGLGSLFLCYLLFQSKLIPRLLSLWGFIGYIFLFTSGLLDIFGVIDTLNGAGMMMYIPGGLWEFIGFPLWLIIKGFNSSAIATGSTKGSTIINENGKYENCGSVV